MKVVVVIPTYNERENTERMIDTLAEVFAEIKNHELHLLYVDGQSPDGTAEVVKSRQSKYKWLHLLVEEKKEGLGMAYAKGMRYAMEKLKADYILEFDGDFQHPPRDIPRLVAEIDHGYDYVIGSRYIKGGSIPQDWDLDRKLLSLVGNLVARLLLFLPKIHDVTGGFKLARVKDFMDQFDWSKLLSRSFAYKIHLLHYMVVQKHARVKEVPVQFQLRTAGDSKIIKNEMLETLRVIFNLQKHDRRIRQFVKFGIVGTIGYLVNAVSLFFFSRLKLPEVMIWALAAELAIMSNFTWNNWWTFRHNKIQGKLRLVGKFGQFNLTSLGALAMQTILGSLGVVLLGLPRQVLLPIIILFAILPYNYFMYTKVIWRKMGTNPR